MSGLETLSPDQRAVLQLILVQGRGYEDLAATLKLDPTAVRERAHAGAAALVDGRDDTVDTATRGRVVDYLLGQQDDGERIVTFAELGDSPAACAWAQALRAQLAGVAPAELPEVPTSAAPTAASANGSAAHAGAAIAAPAAAAPPERGAGGPTGPRPSRLGGAILIGGAAALAIVLAIVLLDGGGGGKHTSTGATTPQTSAQTSTTPRATTTGASRAPAANGTSDIYAIWLQGTAGNRFMGFVPNRVGSDGTFTVSASLDRGLDLAGYGTLLVTREGTTAVPATPGTVVLSGPLRSAG